MFGFAWLALRQAQDAIKDGRLEEALRLLGDPATQAQRGSGALLVQLARALVERGQRHLRRDDAEAAWRDLVQADQLQTAERSCDRLREALTRLGLAEVRGMLQAGEPGRADEAVAKLRLRGVRSPELAVLDEVVHGWEAARDLASRGEFARAVETVERVRRLLPGHTAALERFAAELAEKQRSFGPLLARLHEALDAARWGDVVARGEEVLAVAPNHTEARKARARAWKVVQPPTVAGAPGPPAPVVAQPAPTAEASPRFLLWIDGVGGYLVCLGNRLTFGQATQHGVDVPLVADVSRIHATLTRDAEGYLLETVRPVRVNSQNVTRALLRSNDRITLGATCELRFRQPAPVSTSAVLEIVSGHRLPRSVEGVLLMAETLILGPGPHAHVEVPELARPVILYRHKDGIGLRHAGAVTVNGEHASERCVLGPHAQVVGEEITFALEPVGTRL
jgi:hypothetical protein